MIKKAQMMLQASIGRTAENAEIEQLEATIESAKNLGLPSEDPTMVLAHSLVEHLKDIILPDKGVLTRLKFKANYVVITKLQLQAIRKAIFMDDYEQLKIIMDACGLKPFDSPYVCGVLFAREKQYKWTYRSDLLYDNWGMDWHYRKTGYSIFRHACAQSSINIVSSIRKLKNSGKLKDKNDSTWESAVLRPVLKSTISTETAITTDSDMTNIDDDELEKRDFFVCHAQASGGDQAQTITLHLKARGYKVWYDMDMPSVTEVTMAEGVRKCTAFILFLSENVFSRPFCRLEIIAAVKYHKILIPVYEADTRHGAFDFCHALDDPSIPEDFKGIARAIIGRYEALPYRRKKHEREAMLDEILRLLNEAHPADFSDVLEWRWTEPPKAIAEPAPSNASSSDKKMREILMFPPGYEIVWPILGCILYIVTKVFVPKINAGMLALIVSNRCCSWEYWWKYRQQMGKVYAEHASLWLLWPLFCGVDQAYWGLSYHDVTGLVFCVLFAIAVGFWVSYPALAWNMHDAPGCWWYNLTGDLGNHGPMLVCVASTLCTTSGSSKAFSSTVTSYMLPVTWTICWYLFVFLPWYLLTGDELYPFIPASKTGTKWKVARAIGTLLVCLGLCCLTMIAYKLGHVITSDQVKLYALAGQSPAAAIGYCLSAVYFGWLYHAYSTLPKSSNDVVIKYSKVSIIEYIIVSCLLLFTISAYFGLWD